MKIQPPLPTGMLSLQTTSQPSSLLPSAILAHLTSLQSKKVFLMSNNSSRPFLEDESTGLVPLLSSQNLLAAPLNTSVGMGGGHAGILQACKDAYDCRADVIVTVGGGAIQDAGKFVRLWLSSRPNDEECTLENLLKVSPDDSSKLPPQIAIPNSFALAEASHVAGLNTPSKTKSGAASPLMICTHVVFDPVLARDLPDWVKYGTAMRGFEHGIGVICHPGAGEDLRERGLGGLKVWLGGMEKMLAAYGGEEKSVEGMEEVYLGGWMAVRALFTGCYPALGHLLQNHYSARFSAHQGACSAILSPRLLRHHHTATQPQQKRISEIFGQPEVPASKLVAQLVQKLPGVPKDHGDVGVTMEELEKFAEWMFETHGERVNKLSPRKFASGRELFEVLAFPLDEILR